MHSALTLSPIFANLKVCVLIPTYNNSTTLQQVIEGVLKYTQEIIVVNDGSTDATSTILKEYTSIKQISYASNKGKGWALRTGFRYAVVQGYDYAITIDSDGQHFPSDLPAFIDKLINVGPCLIIGARNMNQSSIPGKSSFGHKFSNFWFWVETGIKAPDTQSGYRLYPVKLLKGMKFITRKFEFEIEVIVRAAWKGIQIESVPVSVYYAPSGERVSHFRPFTDFTRISILNTVLVVITFLYINPRTFLRSIFKQSTYTNLKNELLNRKESNLLSAISVGFGVLMGLIPIWGFQLISAIALSVLFRLNKAMVIIGANISLPPLIPFIIYSSYQMGAFWVPSSAIPLDFSKDISVDDINVNFLQYLYGSITLAILSALIAGLLTYVLLTVFDKKKNKIKNE
ncbi:MAG: DUF2062 domain-containing protein [Bacteroidetes bacterium]|nr:DUF2062 domain-containing protein [Bacteroidota bacterium]